MRPLPTAPRPGDPISANLIRDIIRAIQERTPRNGRNTKVGSFGPNGFTIDAISAAGSSGSYLLPQPFDIEKIEKHATIEGVYKIKFARPYYTVGGDINYTTDNSSDPNDEDYFKLTFNNVTFPCIIYLEVDATTGSSDINRCESLEGYLMLQNDHSKYMIPLYEFGESGEILCDFRNIPHASMGEF